MSRVERIKKWIIRALSCHDEPAQPLQIGPPTNFRHEDVRIEGLTLDEQAVIIEKATKDAKRMFYGRPVSLTPSSPIPQSKTVPPLQERSYKRSIRQRLSSILPHAYLPVYGNAESDSNTMMLQEQRPHGGFEERGVEGGGVNQSKGSVTLGGSEVSEPEKEQSDNTPHASG